MNCTEIDVRDDCEIVYVYEATVSVLCEFLDESVPWVWILGHRPNQHLQWWESSVALNTSGAKFDGLVRNICFDIQMPTDEFLRRKLEFDDHGLVLIQSSNRMPATLSLGSIPEAEQNRVLIQNGATLRIYLPHAIETAQLQSFRKGHLACVIKR